MLQPQLAHNLCRLVAEQDSELHSTAVQVRLLMVFSLLCDTCIYVYGTLWKIYNSCFSVPGTEQLSNCLRGRRSCVIRKARLHTYLMVDTLVGAQQQDNVWVNESPANFLLQNIKGVYLLGGCLAGCGIEYVGAVLCQCPACLALCCRCFWMCWTRARRLMLQLVLKVAVRPVTKAARPCCLTCCCAASAGCWGSMACLQTSCQPQGFSQL